MGKEQMSFLEDLPASEDESSAEKSQPNVSKDALTAKMFPLVKAAHPDEPEEYLWRLAEVEANAIRNAEIEKKNAARRAIIDNVALRKKREGK